MNENINELKKKRKLNKTLLIAIVGIIVLIAIIAIVIVFALNKKDNNDLNPGDYDNSSKKVAEVHTYENIEVSDVQILKRGEIEVISGYYKNLSNKEIKNIILEIKLISKKGEELEKISIRIDSVAVDDEKHYFESNFKATGIIDTYDYEVNIIYN